MIPDIAVVIAAYAGVRLLNEYVLLGPKLEGLRGVLALIGLGVVVIFTIDVIDKGSSISI